MRSLPQDLQLPTCNKFSSYWPTLFGLSDRGGANLEAPTYDSVILLKDCMKMKKNGPRSGRGT